jgi:hypothetical protein
MDLKNKFRFLVSLLILVMGITAFIGLLGGPARVDLGASQGRFLCIAKTQVITSPPFITTWGGSEPTTPHSTDPGALTWILGDLSTWLMKITITLRTSR